VAVYGLANLFAPFSGIRAFAPHQMMAMIRQVLDVDASL
jgi:hypothetical protein